MDLQSRVEVQGAVQQWIASFMNQYRIPAALMEDALNKALIMIKDQVIIDLLAASAPEEETEDDRAKSGD